MEALKPSRSVGKRVFLAAMYIIPAVVGFGLFWWLNTTQNNDPFHAAAVAVGVFVGGQMFTALVIEKHPSMMPAITTAMVDDFRRMAASEGYELTDKQARRGVETGLLEVGVKEGRTAVAPVLVRGDIKVVVTNVDGRWTLVEKHAPYDLQTLWRED